MKRKAKKLQIKNQPSPNRRAETRSQTKSSGDWLAPLIVALVSLVVFLPVLNNEFVHWDDEKMLIDNADYRGLGWTALGWMFTTFHMGHYQPLSWVTLALDYKISGMEPFGYHLTNLLLHAANAVIFYFIARRLLSLAFSIPIARPVEPSLRIAAAFAALLFAVHPLRVESVAWATERRDVLSGLFFLATILCYLRASSLGPRSPGRFRWMSTAFGFYVLSLLSKASGMTLPVVLLVLDVYPLKRLGPGPGRWFGRSAWPIWLEKIPFFGFAVVMGAVALAAQSHIGAMKDLIQHTPLQRLAQAFYGLQFYLWKTLWPIGLSSLYEIPIEIKPLTPPFLLSAAVVIAISAVVLIMRRRWPALLAAWIVYGAVLGPVLGVAQSGPQMVADRYSYLSCLGWALIAGAGYLWCWRFFAARQAGRIVFYSGSALATAILLILSVLTWRQTQIWHDTKKLWQHALSVNRAALFQSGWAQYFFGLFLVSQGDLEGADAQFRDALRINPASVRYFNDAGVALERQGKLKEAAQLYQQALKAGPNPVALNNLGGILARQGQLDQAAQRFREALAVEPKESGIHFHLGNVLVQQGNLVEAAQHFKEAIKLRPDYAEAFHNLGRVVAALGQLDAAIAYFREALRIQPDYEGARNSLAMALDEKRQAR